MKPITSFLYAKPPESEFYETSSRPLDMVVLGAFLKDCMPPKSQGGGALLDTNKLLDQEIFIPNDNEKKS